MFLVTGSGRSGTKYISTVLRVCGLGVGHEHLGVDGIVSGFYCFESDHYPGAHVSPRPKFDLILHQVRDPLKAIGSITTGRSRKWASQFVDVEKSASSLRWSCYYWLAFNLEAERQALFTYRIEDLEDIWEKLQDALSFDTPYSVVSDVPKNINTRSHRRYKWNDIKEAAPEIYGNIRNAARRYGYLR